MFIMPADAETQTYVLPLTYGVDIPKGAFQGNHIMPRRDR